MGVKLDKQIELAEKELLTKRRAGWTGLILTAGSMALPSFVENLPENYESVQWGAYLVGAGLISWGLSHTPLPKIWKGLYDKVSDQLEAHDKAFGARMMPLHREFKQRDEQVAYEKNGSMLRNH